MKAGGSGDMDAGFSLAFTDGSKLDVINAGNASGSHDVSIPGSAGAEGVTVTTGNTAANWSRLYDWCNCIWC